MDAAKTLINLRARSVSDGDKWPARLGEGINREPPFQGTSLELQEKAGGRGTPGRGDAESKAADPRAHRLCSHKAETDAAAGKVPGIDRRGGKQGEAVGSQRAC